MKTRSVPFDIHIRAPDAEAVRRLIDGLGDHYELLWVEPSRRLRRPLVPQDIPCVGETAAIR